jgi:hypothetical protein
VGELVADDVIEVAQGSADREHDPAAERLGDTPGALPEVVDDVGLAELGCGGIQNQRLTAAQLMPHHAAEPSIPALGHPAGDLRRLTLGRVEVHVEVVRLQDLEIEMRVLDLVAAEILGFGPSRKNEEGKSDQRRQQSCHHTPELHLQ